MIRKYVLPLLAVLGVAAAIAMVIQGNRSAPVTQPATQPANAPFSSYIFGPGIVEASTENIAVGTPVSGIVTAIYVKWGERVKTGQPALQSRHSRSGRSTPSGECQGQGGGSSIITGGRQSERGPGNTGKSRESTEGRRRSGARSVYQCRGNGKQTI